MNSSSAHVFTLPPNSPVAAPTTNRLLLLGRWVLRSRITWFAAGALAGVLAALLLVWRVPATTAYASRTILVRPGDAGAVARIADALIIARAGDTVRVEPGIYPERLVVPDGVNLLARVPSSVTLTRASDSAGELWVAITAFGELDSEISGIRIESTAELPVDVGIRVTGQRTLELIELTGPMRAGIELLAGAALTLRGSHLSVSGAALATGDRSEALVTRNVFLRTGRTRVAPIAAAPLARTTLRDNVFAGYGVEIVTGASVAQQQQFAAANVIVSAEPSRPR